LQLIIFTVSRFVGTAVSTYLNAELIVGIWASCAAVMVTLAATLKGKAGLACLMVSIQISASNRDI